MIFKSLTRDGLAYEIRQAGSYLEENGFYKCPGAYLSEEIEEYMAYDDGLTKHSHASIVQKDYFVDCLASLAAYLQGNLSDVERISKFWPHNDYGEKIAFAMTVKYNPDKDYYVSMELQKVSRSEKLKYDKRWERVESWMDGSLEGVFRMALGTWFNALQRFSLYLQISQAFKWSYTMEGCGIHSTEEKYLLKDAFYAVDTLVQAYRMAEGAKRAYRCLKHNWIDRQKRQEESPLPLVDDLNALPVSADLD